MMSDSISVPNVVEESVDVLVPAGGAGDVLMLPRFEENRVDAESNDLALPVSPASVSPTVPVSLSPSVPEPVCLTPPRTSPVAAAMMEPPAVLRLRRRPTEVTEDDEEFVPALRSNAIEAWRLAEELAEPPSPIAGRQIGRAITPVAGENAAPPVCFLSDTEGEDEGNEDDGVEEGVGEGEDNEDDRDEIVLEEGEEAEDGYEQDGEEEVEEEEEETTQLGAQGDGLVVSMPFWIFGLTIAAMTLYLTFVIYLLSWECRYPIVRR